MTLTKLEKLEPFKHIQKQPSLDVVRKRCSEKYVAMLKCDFNKVALQLQHGCSPVNLLHIFRAHFYKNIYGGLFMHNGQ